MPRGGACARPCSSGSIARPCGRLSSRRVCPASTPPPCATRWPPPAPSHARAPWSSSRHPVPPSTCATATSTAARCSWPSSMSWPVPRKLTPDLWLFALIVALVSIGVVMVYSASGITAADRFHDPLHFLKRQGLWVLLGMGELWWVMRVDDWSLARLVVQIRALRWL